MIMVPFLTNQNLTIFTASFTISGSVCDIKISQIKITKHTAKWCESQHTTNIWKNIKQNI